jgi:hypothetical protein
MNAISAETAIKKVHAIIDEKLGLGSEYFQIQHSYDTQLYKHKTSIIQHFKTLGIKMNIIAERGAYVGIKKGKTMNFLCSKI